GAFAGGPDGAREAAVQPQSQRSDDPHGRVGRRVPRTLDLVAGRDQPAWIPDRTRRPAPTARLLWALATGRRRIPRDLPAGESHASRLMRHRRRWLFL